MKTSSSILKWFGYKIWAECVDLEHDKDDEVPEEEIKDVLKENYESVKETTIQNKRQIKVPAWHEDYKVAYTS